MTVGASPAAPPPESPVAPARVQLSGISKRFLATQALDDVSLELLPGEVHALVGENGAGKSTLVKILGGVYQPDSGTIRLDGLEISLAGPAQARALGIAVVHQEPRLFPDLSVAENVFIGHAPSGRFGMLDWRGMRRAAHTVFEELGVRMDVSAPVRGLSIADQQLIEIAKSLSLESRVLVLDEPTASLSAHEADRLFTIVRQLRDRGVAVLFVSHRLDEVFALCDRATVFRDGRHIVTARTADLSTADLVRHMVGREVTLFPKAESHPGATLLEVRGLTRAPAFRDVSLSVRAGEIVGFAGLVGAGRTEVARVLFGIDQADRGEILLDGAAARFRSPSEAMHAGIAYVPEDRHRDGLVLDFSIASNVTLPILPRLFPRLLTNGSIERNLSTSRGSSASA
jgi:rhamnose transport system ATP-binding protein